MTKTPGENLPHHPRAYVNHLARSDEFLEQRAENPDARKALGKTAAKYVEHAQEKSEYLDMNALSIKLIGLLDSFGTASQKLREDEQDKHLDRDERRQYKKDVIAFNHTIREMIDANSSITSKDICDFVGASEMLIGGNAKRAKFVREQTREVVFGLQSEIFTEEALWSIPGVELPELTEEQSKQLDAKGVDLYFTFEGNDYFIDVKATREAYHRAEDKRMASPVKNFNSELFWTGLEPDETGGQMRASEYQLHKIREKLISEFNLRQKPGDDSIAKSA